jgi:hypothetical protein
VPLLVSTATGIRNSQKQGDPYSTLCVLYAQFLFRIINHEDFSKPRRLRYPCLYKIPSGTLDSAVLHLLHWCPIKDHKPFSTVLDHEKSLTTKFLRRLFPSIPPTSSVISFSRSRRSIASTDSNTSPRSNNIFTAAIYMPKNPSGIQSTVYTQIQGEGNHSLRCPSSDLLSFTLW